MTLLRIFKRLLYRGLDFSISYPKWSISLFTLVFIALIPAFGHIRALFSIDDLIDEDFSSYSGLKSLKEDFFAKNTIQVAFLPREDSFSLQEICHIKSWLDDIILNNPQIAEVFSPFSLRQALDSPERFLVKTPFSPDCTKKQTLADSKVDLTPLRESPWKGISVPKEHDDILVEMYLNSEEQGFFLGSFNPEAIEHIQRSWERHNSLLSNPIQSHWSGSGVYQYHIFLGYNQTFLLNGVILLLVLIAFRIFFGTYRSSVIFIISLIYSVAILHGLFGILGVPIDVLSNSLFILLTIATLEDFVFLSKIQLEGKHNWKNIFRKQLLPSFFTSLTTIIGFGSLVTSELSIISRFGLMAALGALIEWLSLFFLIPSLLKVFPTLRVWVKPNKSAQPKVFTKLLEWHPNRTITATSLSVFVLAGVGISHLNIDDSPLEIFPSSHILRESTEYFADSRGWRANVSLLTGDFESEYNIFDKVKQSGLFKGLISEDPWTTLEYVQKDVPLQSRRFTDSIILESPAMGRFLNQFNEGRTLVYLKNTDISYLSRLYSEAEKACKDLGCELAGTLISYREFGTKVPKTLMASLFYSVLLVAMVLLLLARAKKLNLRQQTAIVFSALWGPAFVICILWGLQIQIYFVTCIFASVLVGLAGDNAIQFIFSADKSIHHGLEEKKFSSFYTGVILIILPCVFLMSTFLPMRILGLFFALGTIASLFGDIWVLKGLLGRSR